ncbi:hypothetical protein TorRG33x02_187140 [Trema orientale]|uniref:Uncharacterized protein n=1 Tax=Trema orientale TaxID=63057 RepID=A0A2P5EJ63_TREOI|nr:hypothetical protein TorRG33x02_187140 [Trema orientale]
MDLDAISKLCERLNLDDEDGNVTVQIPAIEKISSEATTINTNPGIDDVDGQRHPTQILEDDSLISKDIMLIDPSKQLDSNLIALNVAQSEE